MARWYLQDFTVVINGIFECVDEERCIVGLRKTALVQNLTLKASFCKIYNFQKIQQLNKTATAGYSST